MGTLKREAAKAARIYHEETVEEAIGIFTHRLHHRFRFNFGSVILIFGLLAMALLIFFGFLSSIGAIPSMTTPSTSQPQGSAGPATGATLPEVPAPQAPEVAVQEQPMFQIVPEFPPLALNTTTQVTTVSSPPSFWAEYSGEVAPMPQKLVCKDGYASFYISEGVNNVYAITTDASPIYIDMPPMARGHINVYCQEAVGTLYIFSD